MNVSKKMLKSNIKMDICWSQIENTFKVRDIGKVPYFDGHKLLFTLPFIFSLLIGITRLTKKTGYDETKTLLHITFALVNKKNLAGSICRTLDQIRNCFNWKAKKIWLKTHKKLDRFLSIHTCVSSPFLKVSKKFYHVGSSSTYNVWCIKNLTIAVHS